MVAVRIKRIYEPVGTDDGQRILVDGIWPRGVSRDDARLDAWMPKVAPSTELRKWFGHDSDRWAEFSTRYRRELDENPELGELVALATAAPTTLLYGARDTDHNQAVVLAAVLAEH